METATQPDERRPQRHGESGMGLAKRLKEAEARVVALQEALDAACFDLAQGDKDGAARKVLSTCGVLWETEPMAAQPDEHRVEAILLDLREADAAESSYVLAAADTEVLLNYVVALQEALRQREAIVKAAREVEQATGRAPDDSPVGRLRAALRGSVGDSDEFACLDGEGAVCGECESCSPGSVGDSDG